VLSRRGGTVGMRDEILDGACEIVYISREMFLGGHALTSLHVRHRPLDAMHNVRVAGHYVVQGFLGATGVFSQYFPWHYEHIPAYDRHDELQDLCEA